MKTLRPVFLACALGAATQPAAANTISQALSCAKDVGNTQVLAVQGGVKMLDLAEKRPECVSKAVGQDYFLFGVTAALAILQKEYKDKIVVGNCEGSLRDTLAKPLAQAIGGIAPPPAGPMITEYLETEGAAMVWNFLSTTPGPDIFMVEVSCGCAFIDAGVNYEDVKKTFEANMKAAASCAGVVKEACKDMASVSSGAADLCMGGLDFVGDTAKGIAQGAKDGVNSLGDALSQQSAGMAPEEYYKVNYQYYTSESARLKTTNPAFNWRDYIFSNPALGGPQTGKDLEASCNKYFDQHLYSAKNAKKICDVLAGIMDAEIEGKVKIYRPRVELAAAWDKELKAKHTAQWVALCGSNPLCPKNVGIAIGGYEVQNKNYPYEYKSWGMFGKMRKALDATGDVNAAIALGASSARTELAVLIAAAHSSPSSQAANQCSPAWGVVSCAKNLAALETSCTTGLKQMALSGKATAATLAAAGEKCKAAYAKYARGSWTGYLKSSYAVCNYECPKGGYFHERCEAAVAPIQTKLTADVAAKLTSGYAPSPDLVKAAIKDCSNTAKVYANWKKQEDAFYAKWAPQCPTRATPVAAKDAVSPCEQKLRTAFEKCGDRYFDTCLDPAAKHALVEAGAAAKDAQAKKDDRMADALKSSGSQGMGKVPAGGLVVAQPKPAANTVVHTGSAAGAAVSPPASGGLNSKGGGMLGANTSASGSALGKGGSALAPPGGPLKPLLDAGCRAAPGDPSSFLCPAPAMQRCDVFKRDGKVKSCSPLH
jgi:hypothetical protein